MIHFFPKRGIYINWDELEGEDATPLQDELIKFITSAKIAWSLNYDCLVPNPNTFNVALNWAPNLEVILDFLRKRDVFCFAGQIPYYDTDNGNAGILY
jgi:hypothetical protein